MRSAFEKSRVLASPCILRPGVLAKYGAAYERCRSSGRAWWRLGRSAEEQFLWGVWILSVAVAWVMVDGDWINTVRSFLV